MVKSGRLRVLPESRSECRDGHRPCPLTSCRYHLLLDVARDGRLFMTRDLDESDVESVAAALVEMPETCALDVADRGASTSVAVAELVGVSREEVERTIQRAAKRVRDSGVEFDEREHREDPYAKYHDTGAQELADITAELRARKRGHMELGHRFDFDTQNCRACGMARRKAEVEQRTCRSAQVRSANKRRKARRGYR